MAEVSGKNRKELEKEYKATEAKASKASEKYLKLAEKGTPQTEKDARKLREARQETESLVKDTQDLYQAIGTIDDMVATFNATSGVTAGGFKITESARDNIVYGGQQFQALGNYSTAFNVGAMAVGEASGPVIGALAQKLGPLVNMVSNAFGRNVSREGINEGLRAVGANLDEFIATDAMTKNQFAKFMQSVRTTGMQNTTVQYVTINGQKYIVTGSNRLKAAKILRAEGKGVDLQFEEVSLPFKGYKNEESVLNSAAELGGR